MVSSINDLNKEQTDALLEKLLKERAATSQSETGKVEVIVADEPSAIQQDVNNQILKSVNEEPALPAIKNLDLAASKLNLVDLGLTDADVKDVMELKNKLGPMDALAVAEYGKDISSATNDCTSEILGLVNNKDIDQTGEKLNQVIHVAKGINSSNFIGKQSSFSRLPIIGGLFKSVEKARNNFLTKFNSTEEQIKALVSEIETNQSGLTNRVHLLDNMFDNVNNDYRSLGLHIAAGHLKLQELKNEIKDLSNGNQQDQNVIQRIYDLNHVCNNLEKRLHDLHVLQQSALQTLPMIRIIQANNLMLVDKFYAIKNITIPAWKNQITLAISLNEQKNSVQLANTIDDATNEILKRNADLLHTNSVSTAKANQRSVIDVSTLEYVQSTLIKTVNEVIQIQQQGVNEREKAVTRLKDLQDNYKKIVKTDSQRIAMKK